MATELVLTGRVIDAAEAARIGLVSRVVAEEELAAAVRALAGEIAANAPVAVRLAKAALVRSADQPIELALELAATYQGIAQRTADHDEGVRALLEKRMPVFEGR
jgi:2-(1,2-epoxy-1,2-dihydrophenyl)acetyl-CoA isomerase